MEIDLKLTPHECDDVILLSESTISSGHWGDGDALFPDEAHVLDKLRKIKKGEPAAFFARDAEIMIIWIENHCAGRSDGRLTLNSEIEHLLNKIRLSAGRSKPGAK
jgi:hypothetical protein